MLKYGFKNLRRLHSVDPIELRPITLLVGRNSSGKSTFLRTFPLFRQSINTRTSSPILWYGDLVDFGSFSVAASAATKNEPIVFTFIIDELPIQSKNAFAYLGVKTNPSRIVRNASVSIFISPYGERTRISRIKIEIASHNLKLDLTFDAGNRLTNILINGIAATSELGSTVALMTPGALFPDLRLIINAGESEKNERNPLFWMGEQEYFQNAVFKTLREPLDARIANKTLNNLVSLLFDNLLVNKTILRSYEKMVSGLKFKEFIKEISSSDPHDVLSKVSHFVTLAALPSIFNSINSHLRLLFASTLYIGPARARSERYYRYQDLAVSEIDPDGKNFPMFLNSLNRKQRQNLSDWIENLYGYGVTISQESGHISIKLVEGDSEANIVDVGYGVSQILPVLGQIWWARARRTGARKSAYNLIAIEQPELHLHPAHQALLADALVGETAQTTQINNQDDRVSFLIETHSETLINRLGKLISEQKIEAEDVQILLFEPNPDDEMSTDVKSVTFDSEGVLVNWPYGFFQPEI